MTMHGAQRLRNFLYAYEWIEAAGEAANGAEALAFCAAHAWM